MQEVRTQFHSMSERPVSEETDSSFSKTVIIYGDKKQIVELGYFDFETEQWVHFGKNIFLLKCWCYIPDPSETGENWQLLEPKGYQRFPF